MKFFPPIKLEEPLKKFENLFSLNLEKLEKIPGEVLNLGEKCFKEVVPLSDFAIHFQDFEMKGLNDHIEKSMILVLNELAALDLGFEVNCLGCYISCFLEGLEEQLKREFLNLIDELKGIGHEAEEELKGFSKHLVEPVHEMKELGTHRIKEFIEVFKLSIVSFPKFVEEEKNKILEGLKELPNVKDPTSLLELTEKFEKITETIILQLKNLVEPIKAVANLLADFIEVTRKIISEETQEVCGQFVESLRKISIFLQGAGDRVEVMMSPHGWTSIFLNINRGQLWTIRQSFMTLQNAEVDTEKVCRWIEATMEFLTGKEAEIDKSNLIVEELRKSVLIVDTVIYDFQQLNRSVENIKELLIEKWKKEKEHDALESIARKSVHNAEKMAKNSVKKAEELGKKSLDAASSVGEKSLQVTGEMGKKSINFVGEIGKKTVDMGISVGEKSIKAASYVVGEKSLLAAGKVVHFAGAMEKKSIEFAGDMGKKTLESSIAVGQKSIEAVKNIGDTSVHVAKEIGNGSIEVAENTGKRSVKFVEDVTGDIIKIASDSIVFADEVLKKSVRSVENSGKKSLIVAGTIGKKSVHSVEIVGKGSVKLVGGIGKRGIKDVKTVASGVGKGFGKMKGLFKKKKNKKVKEEKE